MQFVNVFLFLHDINCITQYIFLSFSIWVFVLLGIILGVSPNSKSKQFLPCFLLDVLKLNFFIYVIQFSLFCIQYEACNIVFGFARGYYIGLALLQKTIFSYQTAFSLWSEGSILSMFDLVCWVAASVSLDAETTLIQYSLRQVVLMLQFCSPKTWFQLS